jgi:enterochelin esterase-like enzyme
MKSSRNYLIFLLIFPLLATVGLFLSACQSELAFPDKTAQSDVPQTSYPVSAPTKLVLPTIIKTATVTATFTQIPPTLIPTEIPCLETSGSINEVVFYSQVLGEDIKTNVYLPPCYDEAREEGYPLLVMLHGQNGVQDQWIKPGMTTLADEWITAKKINPLVIVMPFERLYLQNSYNSKFDLALVDNLLPQLLSQYNLNQSWDYRAIGGLSRGGNWAVRIGFLYPDAFSKVGGHSFTTFAGDMNRVQEWFKLDSASHPAFWFDIGEQDQYRKYSEPFVLYLQQNHFLLEYTVNPGAHTYDYWIEHVNEYLSWYTKGW